jgi:hypothetical protein
MNPKNKREWPMLELECIHCKEVKMIPQRHKHKNSICSQCAAQRATEYSRKKAIEQGKRIGQAGRYPYPLGEWEYVTQKFYAVQAELNKCKSREEMQEVMRRNLDKALEDKELMNWINMHDNAERQAEAEKRRTAKKRAKENIDTRHITWEDWDKLGLGEEWDD